MKRSSSSLDSPLALNSNMMQTAWGFVLYGTGNEYHGLEPKVVIRVTSCSKEVFASVNFELTEVYWERNVRLFFQKYEVFYKFRWEACWKALFCNFSNEEFRAEVIERDVICSIGKYYEDPSNFISREEMRKVFTPYLEKIKMPNGDSRAQFHLASCSDSTVAFTLYKFAAAQGHVRALGKIVFTCNFNETSEAFAKIKEIRNFEIVSCSRDELIEKTVIYCRHIYDSKIDHWRIFGLLAPYESYLSNDVPHADAQFFLGYCYLYGYGVDMNQAEAIKFLQLSAKQENANALHVLGHCFHEGLGVDKDLKKAFDYTKRAADQGHAIALCNLSTLYRFGEGTDVDLKISFESVKLAADKGNSLSQSKVSVHYAQGIGTNINLVQALKYAKMSAEQGDSNGLYNLGIYFRLGRGTAVDLEKAFKCTQMAAELGEVIAISDLGLFYLKGWGIKEDTEQAFKYTKMAADCGDAYAQINLGTFYMDEIGTPKDLTQAVAYFSKAAEQGDAYAQEEVLKLAKLAADQGDVQGS